MKYDKRIVLKTGKYNLIKNGYRINPFRSNEEFLNEWEKQANYWLLDTPTEERREKAINDYLYFLKKFNDFSETFPIYRYIGVNDYKILYQNLLKCNLNDYDGIGIYWAWDRDVELGGLDSLYEERDFGNYDGTRYIAEGLEHLVLLEGRINKKDVDWKSTLLANTHIQFHIEREITILKGSHISINKIDVFDIYDIIDYGLGDSFKSYNLPNIEVLAKINLRRKDILMI